MKYRVLRAHAVVPRGYLAFLGLAFRLGIDNGKATIDNPARSKGLHRSEPPGRLRFLSREEYDALHCAIRKRLPEHLAEYVVSAHTGMRLSEQCSCLWSQVDLERRTIELTKTKNGSARTVHLNADALRAIGSLKRPLQQASDPVFPREGSHGRFDTRSWFQPCIEEAKIANYVWHSNRHTFCSWLAMAGASIKEIQELAGHKAITMSARYSHLSPEHRLSVIDRIATTVAQG